MNASAHSLILSVPAGVAIPEIKIHHTGDKFEHMEIQFPLSSNPVAGSAEIRYNRSTILAINADQPILSISRTDLTDAIEKYHLEIGNAPAVMILSTKSANQVENWQQFLFQ